MEYYCRKCKKLHRSDELCPKHMKQLRDNPQLLVDAANFTTIAGQYHLIASQTLDTVATSINNILGTNLAYEGTHQYIRDIQVFKQLDIDAYCKSGVFSNAENAYEYLKNATRGQYQMLGNKLSGTGQEIDWLRWKQGKFDSLFQRPELLGGDITNAAGIDGVTIHRLTGETVERVSVKSVIDAKNLNTNIKDVYEALRKGTLAPNDTLFGVDGTIHQFYGTIDKEISKAIEVGNTDYAKVLQEAKSNLKIEEMNTPNDVIQSRDRLLDKIANHQAYSDLSIQQVASRTLNGAIVGAAVSFTVSSISTYLRYRSGELDERECFIEIGEDSVKGALVGGMMAPTTLFLPAGAVGVVAGMAIGFYLNQTCRNILDEVYGKGAYLMILDSSGFIYGMTKNLEDCIEKIDKDQTLFNQNIDKVKKYQKKIDKNIDEFNKLLTD